MEGKQLQAGGEATSPSASTSEETRTYTFRRIRRVLAISIGYNTTEVTVDGKTVRIFRYTKFPLLPKYGKSNEEVDVHNVTNVYMKKFVDKRFAWILFLMLVTAIPTSGGTLLLAALALFLLWDKMIIIETKQGKIKIPDALTYTMEMDKLTAHLRRINPDIKNDFVSSK